MSRPPLRPTLLFMHGWAFDASFWEPLRTALADWPQAVADAGYFGPPEMPRPQGPVVAIGHSFGLLRLLCALPPDCIGLVSINGFARFCAAPDFPQGVPARLLDRMLTRLVAQPDAVVTEFRQRCGTDTVPQALRIEALQRDLQALRDDDQRPHLMRLTLPLLVLAGRADPIVPAAMTAPAHAGAVAHWCNDGGHLLPLTHTSWCAEKLRTFLHTLATSR